MRRSLVEKLRCPRCLDQSGDERVLVLESPGSESADDIREGSLLCSDCDTRYLIQDGIVHLVPPRVADQVASNTKAWEDFAGKEGWLDLSEQYLDSLPYPSALQYFPKDTITWDRHCRNFFRVLSDLDLAGKEVLDLGTGRCWASKYLAMQGGDVVATDLMAHETLGLGAGEVLMRRNGIFFERVCCDMNCLPFASDAFDVVFVSGALHHTEDLAKAVSELGRVCRSGGVLAMTNEPANSWRGEMESGDDPDHTNEHNYRTSRQLKVLRQSGFGKINVIPDAYFHKPDDWYYSKFYDWMSGWTRCAYLLKIYFLGGVLLLTARKK